MNIVSESEIGDGNGGPQTLCLLRDKTGKLTAKTMIPAEMFIDPSGEMRAVLTKGGSLFFVREDGALPKHLIGLPIELCGQNRGNVVCDGDSVFLFGFCPGPRSTDTRTLKVGTETWNYLN